MTASSDGTARTWRADGVPARSARRPPWARPEGRVRGRRICGHRRRRRDHPRVGSRHRASISSSPRTLAGRAPPSGERSRRTAARSRGPTGDVVRLRTPERERVLEGHKDVVNSVAFSPDGTLLVSAGRDHDVIVWDVATGEEAFRIEEAQSGSVADARFSPDGRWLVTAGPKSARLWTADGQPPGRYLYGPKPPGHGGRLRARLARGRHTRARRCRAALGMRALRRARPTRGAR